MTDELLLTVLQELHVAQVMKDPATGRLSVVTVKEGQRMYLTVAELKTRWVNRLRELEEREVEIEENAFAAPMSGELPMGDGSGNVHVQVLKRDEQLTGAEVAEKRRLLQEVEKNRAYCRRVIAGMNHLQVHYLEMVPKLRRRNLLATEVVAGGGASRAVWTQGMKSAAVHCLREMRKIPGKGVEEMAREFLERFVIESEALCTPEQLSRSIQQVHMLEHAE